MGVPGNADLLLLKTAAAAGGYQVSRSLRFNSADSAYLSRTPASAGNRKTFTWSAWVKRAKLGAGGYIFSCDPNSSNYSVLYWDTSTVIDALSFQEVSGGSQIAFRRSAAVFRDPSAWYHIVFVVDTTQATASNRIKMYVNGSQITDFNSQADPSQNADFSINSANQHNIGRMANFAVPFDGYLADIWFLDGIAATPSDFAETDATTGQWIPKAYTGSKGTNGFHLEFADNSAATAAALGKDTSGNSNNWTPNNLSVTAGAGNDSLTDTPTSYGTDTGAGGEVRGNYATLNPLDSPSATTLSNGNLDATLPGLNTGGNLFSGATATIGITAGKFYFEGYLQTFNTYALLGVTRLSNNGQLMSSIDTYRIVYSNDGAVYRDGTGLSTVTGLSTFGSGDLLGCAIDISAGTVSFFKNGTLIHTTTSASVVGGNSWKFYIQSASNTWSVNFGQRAWAYPANASGFKALCDTNLTAPVIAKPSEVMDVKLYTGNGSTQTISGLGFSPDLVWIKSRSSAYDNILFDTVRTATKQLISNSTGAEATYANSLTAFNSDGFAVGSDAVINANTSTYAAWTWDAGTSTVTNTQGSITCQLRANATSGFSVATFTGATTGTIGHGLGVAPSMIIMKARTSNPGANDWFVYHKDVGNTKALLLNSTATPNTYTYWNNTSPTSTVFSIGSGLGTPDWVAYCFAPVAGYSSFGSYVGNGSSTDGPFVFTGHRSRWIMVKNTTSANDWWIYDTARATYNVSTPILAPNSSGAEISSGAFDILSNGFKIRGAGGAWNTNGEVFIYCSFAENPFQYARAR